MPITDSFVPTENASLIEYYYNSPERPISAGQIDWDTNPTESLSDRGDRILPGRKSDWGAEDKEELRDQRYSDHPLRNSFSEGCLASPSSPTLLDEDVELWYDPAFAAAFKSHLYEGLYGCKARGLSQQYPNLNSRPSHFLRDKKAEIFPELALPSTSTLQNAEEHSSGCGNQKDKATTDTADDYLMAADMYLKRAKETLSNFGNSIKDLGDRLRQPKSTNWTVLSSVSSVSLPRVDDGGETIAPSSASFITESSTEKGKAVQSPGHNSIMGSSVSQQSKKGIGRHTPIHMHTRPISAKNRQKLPSIPLNHYQMYGSAIWESPKQKSAHKKDGNHARYDSSGQNRFQR